MAKANGVNKELQALISGKTDPIEIAAIVSKYQFKQVKKRNVAAERRRYVESIIGDGKKVSMTQLDGIVWEYAMSNTMMSFAAWLGSEHPEMFASGKAANEIAVDSPFIGTDTGDGADTTVEYVHEG